MKKFSYFSTFVLFTALLFIQCQQRPAQPNDIVTDNGERLYTMYCVRCHQNTGIGGPTPESGPVPGEGVNAIDIRQQTKNVPELGAIISNGWGQMPSFKDSMSAEDIELIASYVATHIEKHPGTGPPDTTGVLIPKDSTK